MLEELPRQRVLSGKLGEDGGTRRRARLGPLKDRKLQVVEQDEGDLLGRAGVEALSGDVVQVLLNPVELGPDLLPLRGKDLTVDEDPGLLHPGKDAHQWDLHVLEELGRSDLRQGAAQRGHQAMGDLRVLRSVEGRLLNRNGRDLPALPGKLLVGLDAVAEVDARHLGQAVAPRVRPREVGGDHRVEGDPPRPKAVAPEDDEIVLQVLADQARRLCLNERTEGKDDVGEGKLGRRPEVVVSDRDVVPLARARRQGDPHDLCPDRVEARRLEVDRERLHLLEVGDEALEIRALEDGPVVRPVPLRLVRCRRGELLQLQLLQERLKLDIPQEGRQARQVDTSQTAGLERIPDRRLLVEGDKAASQVRRLGVRLQAVPHADVPHLVSVLQHGIQRPELPEQLRRRLLAHAGDARDVVRGVADQGEKIRDALRQDAELRLDPCGVQDLDLPLRTAPRRPEKGDALLDELGEVLV